MILSYGTYWLLEVFSHGFVACLPRLKQLFEFYNLSSVDLSHALLQVFWEYYLLDWIEDRIFEGLGFQVWREVLMCNVIVTIDQFQYIKIQPNTIDLSTRLGGINPTNPLVIPQSLVLRFIVLGWVLIYRNWSIASRLWLTWSDKN